MNDETLLALLRSDLGPDALEHDDDADPRLGRMITVAVRRGRRQRAAGRLLATTAGAAVTVVVIAAVTTLGAPISTLGGHLAEPAAPPTSTASSTAPPTTTVSGRDDPQPLPATGRDLVDTLSALLPSTFAISHASYYEFPQGYEMHAGLTVTDGSGSAWVGGGISASAGYGTPCDRAGCSRSDLAGGTLTVLKHVTNSKACDFTRYEYDRPTGGSVWFGQVNTTGRSAATGQSSGRDCDHTTTRPHEPLTDQQVKNLLTDPAWDPLFTR